MKLKCKFGEPHHGWLPLKITAGEFQLDVEISDIPKNPVDDLVSGLEAAFGGLDFEVWFHLEPASYYLRFIPLASNKIGIFIEFSERDTQQKNKRRTVFETEGERDDVLVPFWRAVKEFASHSYKEPAWPKCDEVALSRLDKLVRSK
jgi:hypothetical protein